MLGVTERCERALVGLMTRICGVLGGLVDVGLYVCKDMQIGGAVCAGLLHWRGGTDADVGHERAVLL